MKRIAFVLLAALMAACGGQENTKGEVAPMYLDVRSPEEFAEGHVQGAINIPVDEMEARWQELEPYRDRPIVVYCRSGRRSARAIEILAQHGFTQLENGGGFESLTASGVPAATGE